MSARVELRLVRLANAAALGDGTPVSVTRCSVWLESTPSRRLRTGPVAGLPDGSVIFDAASPALELWEPETGAAPVLCVEVELEQAGLHGRGAAKLALRGGEGSRWCSLRGRGPPRLDGEPLGSCELLVRFAPGRKRAPLGVQLCEGLSPRRLEARALQSAARLAGVEGPQTPQRVPHRTPQRSPLRTPQWQTRQESPRAQSPRAQSSRPQSPRAPRG